MSIKPYQWLLFVDAIKVYFFFKPDNWTKFTAERPKTKYVITFFFKYACMIMNN